MMECLDYFTVLWNERVNKVPGERLDLITMLAHGEAPLVRVTFGIGRG